MQIWDDPLNPGEVKSYFFDWTNDLGTDTIDSASAELVGSWEGGIAIVDASLFSGARSQVLVSGGTAGLVALIKGHVHTVGNQDFYEVGQLKIVDPATVPGRTVLDIEADMAAVRAARAQFMTTGIVKEVSRDGRKIVKNTPTSLEDFRTALADLQRELDAAIAITANRPQRSAIGLVWRD